MQEFGQLGRREAIRTLFDGSGFEPFAPCTVTATEGEKVVSAAALLSEGIDFDLVYFPLKHLGYKSVVEVTGGLYAGLASPRTLQVQLGISAKLDFTKIKELWSGVLAAAREFGYGTIALDLLPSRNGLTISVSACGTAAPAALPAPQSKDLLCVSGALGAAYCGLRLLERGARSFEGGAEPDRTAMEKHRMLVAAYLRPELPAALPEALKESGITPAAAYFVDRGLADALLRLQSDTGLGVKAYADKIPFEAGSFEVGRELDFDPVSAAMNGGDDCRILLVVPIAQYERLRHDMQAFDIIGHMAQGDAGAVLVTPDGLEHPVSAPGWPQKETR